MSLTSFVSRRTTSISNSQPPTAPKELPTLKSLNSNVSNLALFGGDIFNVNHVERELECQICLSVLEDPILLACNSHSICSECLASLFKHQKNERGGLKLIFCPSCGKESGGMKIKNLTKIKVNKELIRVKNAYEKERALWVSEKIQLETKLTDISNMVELKAAEKAKFDKLEKRNLDNGDAECLRDILSSFEAKQLQEVKEMILKAIEAREKASVTTKRRGRPPKNSVEKKEEEEEEEEIEVKTPKKKGRKPANQKGDETPQKILMDLTKKSSATLLLKRTSTSNIESGKKENIPKTLKKLRSSQV